MTKDGGLSGANNPSKVARQEIRNEFPGRLIGCFLSVGTGVGKVVSVSPGYARIASACVKLITDCQIVDHAIDEEFARETQVSPYFRFSVERGVGPIQLHEYKEIDNIFNATDAYMQSRKQLSKIERFVGALQLHR
jgi:hypothetical protein